MLDLTVGASGVPFEMLLERGKIWEFALATKAALSPVDLDGSAVIPPTFLVTSAFWYQPGSWVLEKVITDWSRVLSGGSEFTFHGPPLEPGERLSCRQHVREVYAKAGRRGGTMWFVVFVTEFRRPDGSLVAEEWHTTIETERAGSPGPENPGNAHRKSAPSPTPAAESIGPIRAGDEIPTFVDEPITRNRIVRYQGASGDFNPIHHDDVFAQAAGFPTVFSVGMFHAGLLGGHLARLFGAGQIRTFGVQFVEQMWPGDVLSYGGTVRTARTGGDGVNELDLDLAVTRHGGGTTVRGWATVRVSREDDPSSA